MTDPQPTGYGESADTSDAAVGRDMVDGTPGNDPADRDTRLTTDDDTQREDAVERPGNSTD